METETDGDGPTARADAASREAVDRLARHYVREDHPFARVTVVRREPPVSARVGDRAIVTADGDLTGWIGGVACAQSVAVREAQAVLRRGEPTLVGIAPDPEAIDRPGLDAFPMNCHSEGTLELFVDPVLPLARLVIVGDSPIARAIARLAGELPYDVTVVAPDGATVGDVDERVTATADAAALADDLRGATWVVAASMGATDDVAVEAALAAGVPYVGLIASSRRCDDLCEGVAERTGRPTADVRAAVTSPAGVDIGARTPEEIGVSVLAELVAVRRTGSVESGSVVADGVVDSDAAGDVAAEADGDADADTETDTHAGADDDGAVAVDPVCGMDVTVTAAATATYDGTAYHFCGDGCREAFVDDPERFTERVNQ